MATTKRSKKGDGGLRREEDEIRDELAPRVATAVPQGQQGGPSRKTFAPRKKAGVFSKTASQIREELNLDPIFTKLNVEQKVVDQALVTED